MTNHIDKIIPISAIFLSIVFALSAYHFANAVSIKNFQHQKNNENSNQKEILTSEKKIFNHHFKPKILLVPGHENDNYGAKYGDLKEAEINLILAEKVYEKLSKDFEVYITRNQDGYTEIFTTYFENQNIAIKDFIDSHKNETRKLIQEKIFEPNQKIKHNRATEEIAIKLYGINKWSNENNIDLVLHIHFNDYPRKNTDAPGKYKGFSIYIPEKQLSNHDKSKMFAESLKNNLSKNFEPSNLKIEEDIIIESQSLIAIGSNNTLKRPSVLIEYAYIYEDFLLSEDKKEEILEIMSENTIESIKNYFNLESSS